MKMSNITTKLKALKLELSRCVPVVCKCTLNELISRCVQEKEMLKRERTKSANLASASKDKKRK